MPRAGDQSVGDLAGPGIELAECRRAILENMGDAVLPRLGLVADNVSTGLQDVEVEHRRLLPSFGCAGQAPP
jgi:hypothetical protein